MISSYDVWFGEAGNLQFVGNYAATSVSFGDLATAIGQSYIPEGAYQWRVDTKDAGGVLMVTGDLWNISFSEVEPIVIDDFDSYDDDAELLAVWTAGGGGAISLDDIYGSMEIAYSGASDAILSFAPAQNWLTSGMDTFVMSFMGNGLNDASEISLTVSDSSGSVTITYPQADATISPWWQGWYIRLSDIGVALDDITSVKISISGGNGMLRIDDLRLEIPGCIAAFQPAGDLDKNCMVDIDDFILLAGDWLLKDFAITAVSPDAGRLLAHYKFDQSAVDSAGSNDAAVTNTIWNIAGYDVGCIELVDTSEVTIPAAVFSSVTDEVTISMWISGDESDYPEKVNQVLFAAGLTSGEENSWDSAAWDIDGAAYGSAWNHYAAVKDVTAGVINVYHNGMLVGTTTEATEAMEGSFAGDSILSMDRKDTVTTVKVDDLRVYGYALSQAEIASIAGGVVVQPVEPIYTEYDLGDNGAINLDDFATIAEDMTE